MDKRPAADGRDLREVQVDDNLAKLSEALYVAEHKAREAVAMRSKVQRELMMNEKERKKERSRSRSSVQWLKRLDQRCNASAPADAETGEQEEQHKETIEERRERLQRDQIREERRRERERERRLENRDAAVAKKSKTTRDRNRDVSEKVALGMANILGGGEVTIYDQRLFSQDKGMNSGFAAEDQYNVYDKDLFTAQPTVSTLCRPQC